MMTRYRTIQDAVAQFQKAFQRPTNLDFSRIKQDKKVAEAFDLRQKLIYEECTELIQAMGQEKETQIKKEAADLLYVLAGLFVDFGWDMQVIFNRVHQSNMSKLDENGKPIFREDGKILKSNRYKEADLRGV
jgi:predicted HAD superfamily Cof-like phosphohydrolase|tara:strand:+ start:223 stop:618 length:396 start_codon:yes stop_codon:yes gene_type:complete